MCNEWICFSFGNATNVLIVKRQKNYFSLYYNIHILQSKPVTVSFKRLNPGRVMLSPLWWLICCYNDTALLALLPLLCTHRCIGSVMDTLLMSPVHISDGFQLVCGGRSFFSLQNWPSVWSPHTTKQYKTVLKAASNKMEWYINLIFTALIR